MTDRSQPRMPDGLDRAVGRLESKVDMMIQRQVESDERSSSQRSQLFSRLDSVAAHQARADHQIAQLADDVKKMQPVIKKVENWEQRGVGVALSFAAMGAVFGSFVAVMWKTIAAKLGFL